MNDCGHRMKEYLPFLMTLLMIPSAVSSETAGHKTKLERARTLFYQSVENADSIETALSLFKEIGEDDRLAGLTLTYRGALTALKGKFAWLPNTKYRLVNEGLDMMDQGVAQSTGNIEARFIRGTTCYYLPFFFNRKETAQEDFRIIVHLLDDYYPDYPPDLIMNVTEFLLEHAELDPENIRMIRKVQSDLENHAE